MATGCERRQASIGSSAPAGGTVEVIDDGGKLRFQFCNVTVEHNLMTKADHAVSADFICP